ncbi:MAG: hypothetical protein ACOVLE_01900, partial [Pirellula staleyi]
MVVGILPPEKKGSGRRVGGSSSYGVTVLDVLAAVAIVGVVAVRSRKREEDSEENAMRSEVDTIFRDFQTLDDFDEPFERESEFGLREIALRRSSRVSAEDPRLSRKEFLQESQESNMQEVGTEPKKIKHSKWSKRLAMFGLMLLALLCASPRLV